MSLAGIKSAGGGQAWGNIFTVSTPYTDQVGKEIYNNAQQRALQQQQESKALDDQFAKEAANIRDVDVNDFADKYNDYKQAKINLLKMNPNTNSKDYLNAQLDTNRKLAAMSQFANQSITAKAGLKNVNDEYSKDAVSGKGLFQTDTGTKIAQANALPTAQWSTLGYNPVNTDVYKYQGNLENWQPVLQKAAGTKPTTVAGTTTPLDPNHPELGTQTTQIVAKNSPSEYFNSIYGSFKGANAARSFNATFPSFSDQDAQQITEGYNQLMQDPKAVKAWGKEGMQLPQNAVLTPEGRTLSLMAMKYALENTPTEGKPIKDENPVQETYQKQGFAQAQQQRNYNQQDHLALVRNGYSEALSDYKLAQDAKSQDNVLNTYINNGLKTPTAQGQGTYRTVNYNGQTYSGHQLAVPTNVLNDFAVITGYDSNNKPIWNVPKGILVTDDKKTAIPLFLSPNQSGNTVKAGPETKPVDIQVLKASLSKDLLNKKEAGAAVTNEDFNGQDDQGQNNGQGKQTKEIHKKTASHYGL